MDAPSEEVRALRERLLPLAAPLLEWFRATRRDLPWRRTRDPYRVWISEAMLQQTRVEAVVGHYERFLLRFPTVEALAAAPVDAVLEAWSGLGYYRRARALHATAGELVARHGGVFPRRAAELEALRGIGPYTAGAVASIAHDAPDALVDGNVERVFARWAAWELPRASPRLKERSWALARALVPATGAGEWNQALMELGATVCVPRNPKCLACPVRAWCAGHAAGRAAALPTERAKPATVEVRLVVHAVRDEEGWLLVKRPETGRMAGLVEFPTVELSPGGALWPARLLAELAEGEELFELAHAITRHRIRARVQSARLVRPVEHGAPADEHGGRWLRAQDDEVARLALTGMARKAARRLVH